MEEKKFSYKNIVVQDTQVGQVRLKFRQKNFQLLKFYFGKILPIIKDERDSKTEMINIRPITISDPLSNIFEIYVEQHIETRHKDPEVQFGFKKIALEIMQHMCWTKQSNIRRTKYESFYYAQSMGARLSIKSTEITCQHCKQGKLIQRFGDS